MSKIKMVMFDLSGTTVYDDTGVRDCLYKAAVEFKLKTTPEEILLHMGTNKIHLYQYLIARSRGKALRDLGSAGIEAIEHGHCKHA